MLGLHIGIKKNDLSLFYAAAVHMVYYILKFSIFCLSKNKVELIWKTERNDRIIV